MQGVLYEESSAWLFILVTIIMGGWAAWQTGQAVARTWKPRWQLIFYMILLGWAVRFIHFALFEGTFLSLRYYIIDTLILMAFTFAGWKVQRARQMLRQYEWLFDAAGPGAWKRKAQ
ncbi:MAG TPA: hypothetical protein PK812_06395 [Beijerinckiaceae bacterium]|nr:hypothetical protein [Beijerinckiaceae bacterium]